MGFRKDGWATCWSVEPKTDTLTVVRLSTTCKNKDGESEQDFSGFVAFVGTANAKNASLLKERDRIKLGDVEVKNSYDKEKKTTYTNFKCYSFEKQEKTQSNEGDPSDAAIEAVVEGIAEGNKLPF